MFGGISIWQLAIVLVIVILIFGTKKLRNLGGDVGSAVKNFKSAMDEGKEDGKDDNAKKVADESTDQSVKAEETVESTDKEKS